MLSFTHTYSDGSKSRFEIEKGLAFIELRNPSNASSLLIPIAAWPVLSASVDTVLAQPEDTP